jgi:hypothetical protein
MFRSQRPCNPPRSLRAVGTSRHTELALTRVDRSVRSLNDNIIIEWITYVPQSVKLFIRLDWLFGDRLAPHGVRLQALLLDAKQVLIL